MNWIWKLPRLTLMLIFGACAGMIAFGMYLQHVEGLEPCPMCIVQRYCMIVVGVLALLGSMKPSSPGWYKSFAMLGVLTCGFGAFTAARQSWLQWYPPEFATCGRDFYGMIESYPISRALPMIFKGAGDCAAVDWTLFGGSIANWSFVAFVAFFIVFLLLIFKAKRQY